MSTPDVEQAVLGAILLGSPDAVGEIEGLTVDNFTAPEHRVIFRAVQAVAGRGEPVDLVTVVAELRATNQLDAAGGAAHVSTLSDVAMVRGNLSHYAALVRDRDSADERAPANMHRGQARFAYRLARSHAGRLLAVKGLGWHYWDGRRWAPDDRGETTRAVLDTLRAALDEALVDKTVLTDVRKVESSAGVAGVLTLASALEPLVATVSELDPDPHVLNVANGTLDLHTLQMRPHNPTDRITRITRGAWNPDARSDDWDSFLTRILPDPDERTYVQRLVGVALLGKVVEHVFPVLTGTGANGKTTFVNAVLGALGDYGHTAESDLFMAARRDANAAAPATFGLRGRRLVVVSETERGRKLAMALTKNLTGGDPITARPLYGMPVTFNPSHTAFMVTNALPKVAGDDPAMWRRIRVVPFDVVIPEQERDPHLGERLELAADAILGWAVEGWRQYQAHGLAAPAVVVRATDGYQLDSDDVARFVAESCTVGPHVWATVSELWAAWESWRAGDGAEQMSQKAFGQALDRLGFEAGRTRTARIRRGVGLGAMALDDGEQAPWWTAGRGEESSSDEGDLPDDMPETY